MRTMLLSLIFCFPLSLFSQSRDFCFILKTSIDENQAFADLLNNIENVIPSNCFVSHDKADFISKIQSTAAKRKAMDKQKWTFHIQVAAHGSVESSYRLSNSWEAQIDEDSNLRDNELQELVKGLLRKNIKPALLLRSCFAGVTLFDRHKWKNTNDENYPCIITSSNTGVSYTSSDFPHSFFKSSTYPHSMSYFDYYYNLINDYKLKPSDKEIHTHTTFFSSFFPFAQLKLSHFLKKTSAHVDMAQLDELLNDTLCENSSHCSAYENYKVSKTKDDIRKHNALEVSNLFKSRDHKQADYEKIAFEAEGHSEAYEQCFKSYYENQGQNFYKDIKCQSHQFIVNMCEKGYHQRFIINQLIDQAGNRKRVRERKCVISKNELIVTKNILKEFQNYLRSNKAVIELISSKKMLSKIAYLFFLKNDYTREALLKINLSRSLRSLFGLPRNSKNKAYDHHYFQGYFNTFLKESSKSPYSYFKNLNDLPWVNACKEVKFLKPSESFDNL